MRPLTAVVATLVVLAAAPIDAVAAQATDSRTLEQQVMDAERAFARTMAARDHAAFTSFLADEAIFFTGDRPVRGKVAVAAEWKPMYDAPTAPFSWEPDDVQVLDSGALALSTGPVRDPAGRVIGRFNSIWRLEAPGTWRVVFDKGSPVCPPPAREPR